MKPRFSLRFLVVGVVGLALLAVALVKLLGPDHPPRLRKGSIASVEIIVYETQGKREFKSTDDAKIEALAEIVRKGVPTDCNGAHWCGDLIFRLRDGTNVNIDLGLDRESHRHIYGIDSSIPNPISLTMSEFLVDEAAFRKAMLDLGVSNIDW